MESPFKKFEMVQIHGKATLASDVLQEQVQRRLDDQLNAKILRELRSRRVSEVDGKAKAR